MNSHSLPLKNINGDSLKQCVTPLMALETNLRENHSLQLMHLQENYLKPGMKDELPFGVPSLQDFHHIDQFHHENGSSNPIFGIQTPNFGPFDFQVYEGKPFAEQNGCGHAHHMENIQYQGYSMNLHQGNQQDMNMLVANQSYYMPFNTLETKPLNFVAPDEMSCISQTDYHRRIGLNKNMESQTTRRAFKSQKKSNIVKGQWTVDEDRCNVLCIFL